MTWWDVEPLARAGIPVRMDTWPAAKTLVYTRGGGTRPAVAVISTGTVTAVVGNGEFGKLEFEATNWRAA